MNSTCERPNGVKAHGDESLRNSCRGRLVRARAIHDPLPAVTGSSGVFLHHFEGDRSGYHPVPGAALARPRVDHHEGAARIPQARELRDRYAAQSKLVEELVASPPLQRQKSREETYDEDGSQPAEGRELREYAVDGVVKDDAECDACARPERRTDQVVEHETAQRRSHDSRHCCGHSAEPGNELRKRQPPRPEAREHSLGAGDGVCGYRACAITCPGTRFRSPATAAPPRRKPRATEVAWSGGRLARWCRGPRPSAPERC